MRGRRLAELAVLAAASVVAGAGLLLPVGRFLARHAEAHAGQRLAPRLRDRRVALLAVAQARTLRQAAARTLDRVLDGRVDLFLNRVVASPSGCHGGKHTRARMNGPALAGTAAA